jgi:hypothetical protein
VSFLALVLFAPWFALLGGVYWAFPRSHAVSPARRRFDVGVLATALVASAAAMLFAYRLPWQDAGPLWPQVVATLAAYHVFLAVLAGGWFVRGRRFGAPR